MSSQWGCYLGVDIQVLAFSCSRRHASHPALVSSGFRDTPETLSRGPGPCDVLGLNCRALHGGGDDEEEGEGDFP